MDNIIEGSIFVLSVAIVAYCTVLTVFILTSQSGV